MTATRPVLLPWLVLAATLGVTCLVWNHERHAAREGLRFQFDFSLREATSRIEQRMAAYEQMLRGVQGLLVATGTLQRDIFRAYVGSLQLDANFSGIQAIGIAELVPAARKDAHVTSMRRLGFADYTIRPEGQRDIYVPINQREPDAGRNRISLGFDPWSDPVQRLAMENARDSGMVAISDKSPLAVDAGAEAPRDSVMYLAIYAKGQPHDSVTQRRAYLTGWLYATFDMNDLMASLYGEQPPGLALAIYDGVEPSAEAQLYRSPDLAGGHQPAIFAANEYLVIAGHTWTLSMTALDDFEARFGRNAAPMIAWAGAGISLLLALLAWMMATGRGRALQLAASMTKELRESEQRWAFALEGAGDGVWDWDLQTRTAVTSRRWKEIVGDDVGYGANTIDRWEALIHPDDRAQAMVTMQACLTDTSGTSVTCVAEHRIRCGDGQWKWILLRGMVVEHDAEGRPLRVIGTLTDITERKATEERINHMAQHDALTDLPNRALFSDRLQREVVHANRLGGHFALIFLDLDQFKPINDNFGHAVGDHLLQQVAMRLQDSIRKSDTVGRIGGDEFVVLMSGLTDTADAYDLAEKIRHTVRQPFAVDGHELAISCSLGIAVYPDDGADEITLAKSADDAMYRAKEGGRDRVQMAKAS